MSEEVLHELTSKILRTRGSIAADKSHGKNDDEPRLIEKRQHLAALQLERAVQRALANAAPPTNEQLARIAALLRAGSRQDAAG